MFVLLGGIVSIVLVSHGSEGLKKSGVLSWILGSHIKHLNWSKNDAIVSLIQLIQFSSTETWSVVGKCFEWEIMAEKIVYEIETQSISMVRWALKKHPN